jgi:predicted small lipoprotein YifL
VESHLVYVRAMLAANRTRVMVAILVVLTEVVAACGTNGSVYVPPPIAPRRDSGQIQEPPLDEDAGEPPPVEEPDASTATDSGSRADARADAAPVCVKVKVMVATTLNVRATPTVTGTKVGDLPNAAIVDVLSKVRGDVVSGNDVWYEIQSGALRGYISGFYASCVP